MIHHSSVCIDVYAGFIDKSKCNDLINTYNITCKQISKLKNSWAEYHKKNS